MRHGESAPAHPDRPFAAQATATAIRRSIRSASTRPNCSAERLQHETISAIYVTSLQRTHQTAAPLAARLGLTPIEEPDLREVFLGEWEEGEFRRRAAMRDPIFEQIFVQERWDVIPGAEPHEEFDARVWRGFQTHRRRPPRRAGHGRRRTAV